MLTLSIQQPWAWLIVTGHKNVENRTWPTRVRGRIQIHAGKKFDHDGYSFVLKNFTQIELPTPQEIKRGGIVGIARIIDCVEELDSPWFFGPYGFVLDHAEQIAFRPCQGRLGFFKV